MDLQISKTNFILVYLYIGYFFFFTCVWTYREKYVFDDDLWMEMTWEI